MHIFLLIFSIFSTSLYGEVTITTSGGVSLGAYKAGYHSYLNSFLKDNKIEVYSLGGASAGGINAFLSMDALCQDTLEPAEKSLHWNLWVDTGINELYARDKVTEISLFHREGIQKFINELKKRFLAGYKDGCNKILTMPLTNLEVFNNFRSKRVFSPTIVNYVAFEISGQGIGKPAKVRNIPVEPDTQKQIFLPFGEGTESDFSLIEKILYATSAFPIAFPPVKIPVCFEKKTKCDSKSAVFQYFSDGGLMDNAPLDLTVKLIKKNFPKSYSERIRHLYINTSNIAFKQIQDHTRFSMEDSNLFLLLSKHFNNFLEVARNEEEAKMFDADLTVTDRTYYGDTILPPMSTPLFAFLGFFEKGFRKFDFHLGEHDAMSMLEKYYSRSKYSYPPMTEKTLLPCVNLLRSSNPKIDEIKSCEQSSKAMGSNQAAILQLAMQRAHIFCNSKSSYFEERFKRLCSIHRSLPSPIKLDGFEIYPYSPEDGKANPDEIGFILNALDYYRHEFQDLDSRFGFISSSRTKIHEYMKEMLDELEKHQSVGDSAFMNFIDSKLLESIESLTPEFSVFTNIGTAFEIGISKIFLGISKSLVFEPSVYVEGVDTFLSSEKSNLILTPNLGVSYNPSYFRFGDTSFKLGLQYGYQLNINDSTHCKEISDHRLLTDCKGVIYYLNTSLLLFERVNLKLAFGFIEDSPKWSSPSKAQIMVGYHFF